MQRPSAILIVLIIYGLCFIPEPYADEVILTTGERFSTSKAWEENGKIRFNMNGLVVSVNKPDVAAVIHSNEISQSVDTPNRPPPLQNKPSTPLSVQKTLPSTSPKKAPPTPQDANSKLKVKGIGFGGISWHMRPTDLSGLAKIKTEPTYGGIDQYWRPDGSMTLGNVLLDGLVFGFWQNRLYTIMMWVDGKSAYLDLQQVVFNRYGDGQQSQERKDRHVWLKDRTTDRMLEFDEERNIGIFWMRSRDLDTHIKQKYPQP